MYILEKETLSLKKVDGWYITILVFLLLSLSNLGTYLITKKIHSLDNKIEKCDNVLEKKF